MRRISFGQNCLERRCGEVDTNGLDLTGKVFGFIVYLQEVQFFVQGARKTRRSVKHGIKAIGSCELFLYEFDHDSYIVVWRPIIPVAGRIVTSQTSRRGELRSRDENESDAREQESDSLVDVCFPFAYLFPSARRLEYSTSSAIGHLTTIHARQQPVRERV